MIVQFFGVVFTSALYFQKLTNPDDSTDNFKGFYSIFLTMIFTSTKM